MAWVIGFVIVKAVKNRYKSTVLVLIISQVATPANIIKILRKEI